MTGITELAFRVCFLPAGVHPLELSKLLLGHLGAILVKHDGAPGGFPDFGNLFGGWLLILSNGIAYDHSTFSFPRELLFWRR